MNSIRIASLITMVVSLCSCAAAPSLQGAHPKPSQDQKYGYGSSEQVTKTDHMTQHLNANKSIVYFQNQGGGGAGLGLLLGPLGVVANMKMIEGVTNTDIEKLKGKINLNPSVAFQQAATTTNFTVQSSANQNDIKVVPYILLSKTNPSTINVSSIVLLEGSDGKTNWVRRYQYQLPGKYTLDELSKFDSEQAGKLQEASVNGFTAVLNFIESESDVAISKEQKITFKSAYLNPRWEFEMLGSLIQNNDGRVWVRTTSGVTSVISEDIQYQLTKN